MLTREEQDDLTLLINGSRAPMDGMEKHFLQVIHGKAMPATNKEKEWADFYTNNFSNLNDNIRNNSVPNKYPPQKQKINSQKHTTGLQRIANNRRLGGTSAEITFERILNTICGGKFKGRFQREWAFGGKWILDFFFHEVRLGIEVDGGYHNNIKQMFRDIKKELELERTQVTLLRLTNEDVLGDRNELLRKFLAGWRTAKEAQSKNLKLQPKTKSKAIARIKYVATTGSAERVFHRPTCGWMRHVPLENEITFTGREAAIKRGYAPCKSCRP